MTRLPTRRGSRRAEIQRIRNADLSGFTLDHLMRVAGRVQPLEEVHDRQMARYRGAPKVSEAGGDRRVVAVGEVTEEDAALIAKAEVPAEYAHLDDELPDALRREVQAGVDSIKAGRTSRATRDYIIQKAKKRK